MHQCGKEIAQSFRLQEAIRQFWVPYLSSSAFFLHVILTSGHGLVSDETLSTQHSFKGHSSKLLLSPQNSGFKGKEAESVGKGEAGGKPLTNDPNHAPCQT